MQTPPSVIELVKKFERHLHTYKSGAYNETQVRVEFINPLFEALGWDVYNKNGYSDQYKDVIHEFSLKTQEYSNAPDYLFKVGTMKKFFVEAKKPVIYIKEDIHPAYQLRRYAWSAKLPLSILTDFEEFAVYDCRLKPNQKDKASVARRLYYTFREYPDMWDDIHSKFSREAVLQGEFDKFAEGGTRVKGTEVDDAFLREIEGWRDSLARNIALRNPRLSGGELNFSVQKIIDRIIFLRICEGRGIEEFKELHNLGGKTGIYKHLLNLFRNADKKYNSGLFHFTKEKDISEDIDNITPALSIDDKIFKDIIESLYYPKSPYEFSVFGAEILGHVYEQFLGKVIRLTAGHQAKVEEKPEVKKAGGVYYTPAYIVDYIVKNTLGKKLEEIESKGEGKVKKMIEEASKLRVLDPACGSGSFLLGAYQYLLDWHIKIYQSREKEFKERVYRSGKEMDTGLHLTTKEKKRILLNNIYGVDIDSQAVEVSKLSLLLKVLEGETDETLAKQLDIFTERALPDLSRNIKCGNSLIDTDFYDGGTLFEEETNVNPFNWQKGFPEVFKNGGFDVVIGNPPYVKIQNLTESQPRNILKYFSNNYKSAASGNYDIYLLFIEKAYKLLRAEGYQGFINPHKFFNSNYGKNLREFLLTNKCLYKIIHFEDNQIFKNATTYTCLLFLSGKRNDYVDVVKLNTKLFHPDILNTNLNFTKIDCMEWENKDWSITKHSDNLLLKKLFIHPTLGDLASNIFQGPKSGADDVFILKMVEEKQGSSTLFSKSLNSNVSIENSLLRRYIKGKFIRKYLIEYLSNEYELFPYEGSILIKQSDLKKDFPNTWKYFDNSRNKEILRDRENGRFSETFWQYSRPQNMNILTNQKVITPFNAFGNSFALDNKGDFIFSAGVSGAYGIILKDDRISYKNLCGILNSKLIQFIIFNISSSLRGGFYSYENKYLKQLPIPIPSSTLRKDIDSLVTIIINLFSDLNNITLESERTQFQTKIDYCEDRINKIVYELYGLTEEEIKIVEGKENN